METQKKRPVQFLSNLEVTDPEVASLIKEEFRRQFNTLELIPSENLASPSVLEALGTLLTNKYAEGYPGRRYYGGCQVMDKIESLAIERALALFGAEHANVQPHCGSSANLAVYYALLEPGDKIMGMDLAAGGHLSHGSPVNFSGRLYEVHPYGVARSTETIDYDEVLSIARNVRPKLIMVGYSSYPRVIDFAKMREIADEVGAYMVVDMAHFAGLVAGGVYPNPVPYADVVTSTTQKTLRGAWGGLILCKKELAKKIDSAVFPGVQGGPLMHAIAAKAVCFGEALKPEFKLYAEQVVCNAKALASELMKRGYRLVSGGTDNHMMLIDLRPLGVTGRQVQEAADSVGITVNRNAIPFDEASRFNPSGIRLGTPSVTTRGMKEAQMSEIADALDGVIRNLDNSDALAEIRQKTLDLCNRFPLPYSMAD
jgi:glycine hydroxymethyltransferase